MDISKPMLSRRGLLLAGGVTVAAAALAAPFRQSIARRARRLVRAQPWTRHMVSLADAGYEEWESLVGSTFAVGGGSQLRLAGVRALPSAGERPPGLGRDKAFVAIFDGLAGARLPGDLIYAAGHSQYAPFQIFLSASADPATPGRMLAVFN